GVLAEHRRLTEATQIARMLFAVMHKHPLDHRNAKRVDKLFQLREQALRVSFLVRLEVGPDKKRALDQLLLCFDFKHPINNLARIFRWHSEMRPKDSYFNSKDRSNS